MYKNLLFSVFFSFVVLFSNAQNSELLKKTVKFYGAQRCGNNHNWILVNNASGSSCHLLDGKNTFALNLNGGWHDAGDFIKFTLTTASASYALLKAYDTFPGVFKDEDNLNYSGLPNNIPDILDEVKAATDYLIIANISTNILIARVGGDQDHDYWVTSPYQTGMTVEQGGGSRPIYSNAKADICGTTSAALAMMSRIYRSYDREYADICIQKAQTIFQIGLNNLSTTADNFYADDDWKDNMMCGAIELYRATNNSSYYTYATTWESQLGRHYWVLDWSNQSDLARHSLFLMGYGISNHWRNDVNNYLTKVTNDTYVKGLAFFGNRGSLRYAANAAFSAALLYKATSEEQYKTFALSQLDYIKGNNEYNRSFIVGYGNNPPQKPHHKNSYGREVFNGEFNQNHLYPLVGAMVAGPTKTQEDVSAPGYQDDIQDYVGNKVSIDYNSGIVGLLAFAESLLAVSAPKLDVEIGQVKIQSGQMYYSIPYYSNVIHVQIFDVYGRKILQTTETDINLNNTDFPKGYYVVSVIESSGKKASASILIL